MTKTMKNKITPTRRAGGFTLIEMLVVAALIAIFAGLAVFAVVEQLNREKEKAAIAETRSIATAMSFAYDDMGFFPKLCFLRFGQLEFLKKIADENISADAVDWYGKGGSSMLNMIQKNWGQKYLAGAMAEKSVKMKFPASGGLSSTEGYDWPCDPWNQPYMAYLIKIERPKNNPAGEPVIGWANETLGDKANYFAGIVSYGRNLAPGYVWNDPAAKQTAAMARRLYDNDGGIQRSFITGPTFYNQPRLDWFVEPEATPGAAPNFGNPPHIRDATSDDKYYEF